MDKLLDIVAGWGGFWQFIGLGLAGTACLNLGFSTVRYVTYYTAVIVRGWPQPRQKQPREPEVVGRSRPVEV